METKFNVGDISYYVHDYKLIKIFIKMVTVQTDKSGTTVLYTVTSFTNKKEFQCREAELVDNLSEAKSSALQNWDRICKDVYNQLNSISEKDFEPLKESNEE